MKPSVLLAVVLAAHSAVAEEVLLVRKGAAIRVYRIADDLTVTPLNVRVIDLAPSPTPTPTPVPDTLTPRARAIKEAADAAVSDPNRGDNAGNLSALTREIAKRVGVEIKGYELISLALTTGFTKVLEGQQVAAWVPVRRIIGNQLASLAQEGATDAAYAAYLTEVADGLAASSGPQLRIDIQKILEIIRMILALIDSLKQSSLPQASDGLVIVDRPVFHGFYSRD